MAVFLQSHRTCCFCSVRDYATDFSLAPGTFRSLSRSSSMQSTFSSLACAVPPAQLGAAQGSGGGEAPTFVECCACAASGPADRAAARRYEFSPPNVDCHVTLPQGSCPSSAGRYHASLAWSAAISHLEERSFTLPTPPPGMRTFPLTKSAHKIWHASVAFWPAQNISLGKHT